MIKIAILEDNVEVSTTLKDQINAQEDLSCQHTYINAEEAIVFVPRTNVDILIVDIKLPRASGIEAIKTLSEHCPKLQYCMFTVYEDDDRIFASLQAGAKGYILKNATQDKILESIRDLYNGGSPMSSSIARRVIEIFSKISIKSTNQTLPLTDRETELLNHLAKGFLYKEIAQKMDITLGTVKQHIHKIYEKLQVTNKTQAINKWSQ